MSRKRLVLLLFGAIIISAIIQQLDYLSYNLAFISPRAEIVTKPFVHREDNLAAYADIVEVTDEFIRIEGWATLVDRPSRREQVYVFLKNEKDSIMLSTLPVERPDVSEAQQSWRYQFAGYKIFFPACRIPEGKYRLGFMIEGGGEVGGKWLDQFIDVRKTAVSSAHCDSLMALQISDHISLQRYYFRDVGAFQSDITKVGFVGDTLPFPFNEIRAGEAAYCVVPHVLKKGLRGDLIVCSFPVTRSLQHPDNPLYNDREKYEVMKDFGNGILVLRALY